MSLYPATIEQLPDGTYEARMIDFPEVISCHTSAKIVVSIATRSARKIVTEDNNRLTKPSCPQHGDVMLLIIIPKES